MLSFDDYQNKYTVGTIGQQLKEMSDEVIQETFDNDIGTRQCYIYDYYHDDQADMEYGYNPALSKTKIPVKLKFIVKTYKSMAKDDPEYHIMFEPDVWNSMSCKPDWFKQSERLGIRFPVGLYCDLPDDRGVYHRWLIMYKEEAAQFPKFGILRCNHRFQWIENDGVYKHKRQMWGIDSSQSSYTSGKYTDFKMTSYDEQDKFHLPYNFITTGLRHDTRLFISMLQKEPWVYIVTKVNNTTPKGIITFTVKQDRYNQEHDYVQLDPNAPDYGDMYANYYTSNTKEGNVPAEANDNFDCEKIDYEKYTLIIEAANSKVKLGAAKVLYAKIYDGLNNDVTHLYKNSECVWNLQGVDFLEEENELITNKEFKLDEYYDDNGNLKYRFKCKFKFIGDEYYLEDNINVTCQIEDLTSDILLEIIAL